jgi:putative polyketide hydroxylase
LPDVEGKFIELYGISSTGAALITPDGFVAWRASSLSSTAAAELQDALAQVLQRSPYADEGAA